MGQFLQLRHLLQGFPGLLPRKDKACTAGPSCPDYHAAVEESADNFLLDVCIKIQVVPRKFWTSAVHGIAGCPASDSLIGTLRSAAVNALGLKCAGSSPMLRLSLSTVPESDPGPLQAISTVMDFKRAGHRCNGFVREWSLFLKGFSGRLFQGPGSKLLQVSAQLGWHRLSAQGLVDEGLELYFLECPEALLRRLLLRAWMQFLAHKHRGRKTMTDMHSVDNHVCVQASIN